MNTGPQNSGIAAADGSEHQPRPPLLVEPVAALRGLRAYAGETAVQPIDLRLDGNEGLAPDVSIFEAAARAGVESVRRYPSVKDLEAALAARLGCDPACVLVTAGADDGLDRACRAVLSPGDELVTPTPTFEMIPRSARLAGAAVAEVPWWDGPFPRAGVLAAVTPRTRAIAVVSPNNPTGLTASADDVRAIAGACPSCLILLDGAYEEFADEPLTPLAFERTNIVAFRTLSKAWGLAGLRIGYCFGDERVIAWLRAVGGPYAVSGPSVAMATDRLASARASSEEFIGNVRREREILRAHLSSLGLRTPPSQGNFVLASFPTDDQARTPRDDSWTRDALAGLGILVRRFVGRPELTGSLRITCPGAPAAFSRLTRGLTAALAPRAMLFDLDGVLADVSRSYRAAIVGTCAAFGVTVTLAQIADAKAEGDANNDWILSQRLMARAGVERSLDEVTRTFEKLYQGTPDVPGLRATESLLCAPEVLRRLSVRIPLAIVTGRPRDDAMRFLAEKGILPLFRTVVCMEDAELKPSPAPALRALSRLGVSEAWMIGDTVDDVRCARAAGVVPLGVVQPGEAAEPHSRARAADVLLRAGAARVLDSVEQLEELVP